MTIGLCECGCGAATLIAKRTSTRDGTVKGQPLRFLRGHHRRVHLTPPADKFCGCGCGELTPIATTTQRSMGHIRGQRHDFIAGHHARVKRPPETYYNFAGDNIDYKNAHRRIARTRGTASNHSCIDGCGRAAQHWSYDYSDSNEKLDLRTGFVYSIDPDHYAPRCVPCHKKFDQRKAHS